MSPNIPVETETSHPTLKISPNKLVSLTESLMLIGVGYRLGAKVVPISLQAGEFQNVDCSGFVRWAIYHATRETGEPLEIPDGSSNQHDWVREKGFAPSNPRDGYRADGAVRIAFLPPELGGGIGHVMFVIDGLTCESHGGRGPDQRRWGSESFMSRCAVYVLTPPSE